MSEEKKYTLTTQDEQTFEVDESICVMSSTIKHMIEDDCADTAIPLPNVTAEVLVKVIEYCKKHVVDGAKKEDDSYRSGDDAAAVQELKDWTKEFTNFDQKMLFDLILAANFLDIKGLLDMLCLHVAEMMKGKTPEQIRETFHIVNDYSPEEEEEVRRENAWAFE